MQHGAHHFSQRCWPHFVTVHHFASRVIYLYLDSSPLPNAMARSSPMRNARRRRKSRLLENAEGSSIVIDTVARRRSAATSDESSSTDKSASPSSSSHPPLNDVQEASRRLRRRKASAAVEDDRKITAQVLNNSTNAPQGQKRSAPPSSSSSDSSATKTKKKRKSPSVSISTEAPVAGPPLTRLQRQLMAKQVTPSPANTASAPFPFQSPLPKRRLSSSSSLPDGVLDLYPSKEEADIPSCQCGQEDCSSRALTTSFIFSYGKEYWTQLKESEAPAIIAPSPSSPQTSTSALASPRSSVSSSSSSTYSTATPDQRRDYVYIDTSSLEVTEPTESNTSLHYQPELTPKMRAILVDWIIELSEHFDFGPSALHLAVTLVDKVLACGPLSMYDENDDDDAGLEDGESKTNCFLISRDRFQLLGAACTWLACKVEEMSPPSVSEIAYVSDNIYSTEQIKRMERRICIALNFSLIHQTPYPYIYEFIRASNECPKPSCHDDSSPLFSNMVMYLLELGRLPYTPVTKKPSLLAASAVYAARVTLGIRSKDVSLDLEGRWTRTLKYYTGYTRDELRETVLAIHGYHQAAEDSTLKSVFAKYRSKKYNRVALKTVPRLQDLGF
jgi:hypothetical protein